MDISVIICTYNRSCHLRNVLNSLSEQVLPDALKWEIIVVDNNSMDDTNKVVKSFANTSLIPVKYVKEERMGVSYARNRGIMESNGSYLAFIDDDAIAHDNWLAALYDAFQRYKCDCVGGKIYLRPVKKLPRWLRRDLWGFLAYLDYGDKPFQIEAHYLYGPNMAVTKEVLNNVGLFNTELGRSGYIPTGGEETELVERIVKTCGKAYYQPDAKVDHLVEEYKMKKSYFRRLHYYEGLYRGKTYDGMIKRHIYGIPLFVFSQFFRSILRYLKTPTVRMQMNIWWFLGFMRGRINSH